MYKMLLSTPWEVEGGSTVLVRLRSPISDFSLDEVITVLRAHQKCQVSPTGSQFARFAFELCANFAVFF